jgi:transposase
MRPKGSAAELEARRRWAARLLAKGLNCTQVAEFVGAHLSSVKRWKVAWKKGGVEALAAKTHPGRTPRLSARQKWQLEKILLRGPLTAGYSTDLWTCPRVAEVIHNRFGVRYHVDHVWRLLRNLNWSCQKPERRARERDEAAIRRWRKRDWPRIKKERSPKS